jgi:hypothetical protein
MPVTYGSPAAYCGHTDEGGPRRLKATWKRAGGMA